MKSTILLSAGLVFALATAGCTKQQSKAADVDAIKTAIQAGEAHWNQDFHARNLDRLVSYYAANATFVGPGMAAQSGTDQIRAAYEGALKDPNFDISFASDQVDVSRSGDLAYTRGRYTMKSTDAATKKPASQTGTYLTVYKPQPDGSWKAVADFTEVDPSHSPAG